MRNRAWVPRRPVVRRRADHTGIVGCDLVVDGVAVAGPGAAADPAWLHDRARGRNGAFVWLGLHEPTEAALARTAEVFGLHRPAVEDILHRDQRVTIDLREDVVCIVARTARYVAPGRVVTGFVRLFVGPHFVVTVRQGTVLELASLRADLLGTPQVPARGPWWVAHAILDRLVDGHADIAAALQADIESVEAAPVPVEQIYQLKRQLRTVKAVVLPLQRPLAALAGKQVGGPPREIRRDLRDVARRHAAAVDQVTAFDDVLTALLQARLAQLTVDQNNDLRKIASWAAIAAVPTAIAGVYGMNFADLPELTAPYGYPGAVLIMLVSAVVLHRLLRHAGWL